MATCSICKRASDRISRAPGVCLDCIRKSPQKALKKSEEVHRASRQVYHLPAKPPSLKSGRFCGICSRKCILDTGNPGYCGKTGITGGSGNLSYSHDPHPVNCVSSRVCAGATSAGYPEFSQVKGCEKGSRNLAVFFNSCNFNCLFCQNYDFRHLSTQKDIVTLEQLIRQIRSDDTCVCFFGGDPTPQIRFALSWCDEIIKRGIQIRVCWETNGSMKGRYLDRMVDVSLKTGGTIKFDLKAWNDNLHRVLTGMPNGRILENFRRAEKSGASRPDLPLLTASTLLIPGYIDVLEISKLSAFIARINPEIPYTLLGFSPLFHMSDLPKGKRDYAESCLRAARDAGLTNVQLENEDLFI